MLKLDWVGVGMFLEIFSDPYNEYYGKRPASVADTIRVTKTEKPELAEILRQETKAQ